MDIGSLVIIVFGLIMVLDAFGAHIPHWFSPAITFGVVGFFLFMSLRYNKNEAARRVSR